MKGQLFIEKMQDEKSVCVFKVPYREDVIALTLELMTAGFDVLYEPRYTDIGYNSCVICGEGICIRIVADADSRMP